MPRSTTFFAALIAVLAVAFASNPDEKSFKKYIESKLKSDGRSWFERKAAAQIASVLYQRKDYKFFSVIDIAEDNTRYVGLLSLWLPFPLDWSQAKN
ncbi:hypothetical protein AMAG_19260 [Allomyces macrogynus ATCC 38327]|uniref:Cystatin domain-containing protein n=1 Tax=Allomyces macrogynus (strain ATCC 38327) TaxID=578462 RepID=A0A0L0SQP5_ALLM3|nr:hypothetical protein AMAG_19260 [Allomyces macrogynus ATCC 38327]|eukprot:KNE64680.1 hypothetical protein AMAG_19260 [Allomyces macrogynus ATCC 38327]